MNFRSRLSTATMVQRTEPGRLVWRLRRELRGVLPRPGEAWVERGRPQGQTAKQHRRWLRRKRRQRDSLLSAQKLLPSPGPRLGIGFLNVRTLRMHLSMVDGGVMADNLDKIEVLKRRMQEYHLYVLALSETRLGGGGSQMDVGDGYVLVYAGPGGGMQGVAWLLSPAAVAARHDAGDWMRTRGDRILPIALQLGGGRGGST